MPDTPARNRRLGRIVVICGLVAAVLVYFVQARAATPTGGSSGFEHTRSSDNQMRRSMGQFGLVMADWESSLSPPAWHAVGVMAVALLLAVYFFRVAAVMEEERREGR